MRPLLPRTHLRLLDEVFRYDLLTQPIYCPDGNIEEQDLELRIVRGRPRYVRRGVRLAYDVPAIAAALRSGRAVAVDPDARVVDLYYLAGAESAVTSTNHEIVMHHMGQMLDELDPEPPGAEILERVGT